MSRLITRRKGQGWGVCAHLGHGYIAPSLPPAFREEGGNAIIGFASRFSARLGVA